MINFPIVVMDDFYDDPDEVRNWALRQEYKDSTGHYPGKRTDVLHNINRELFDNFSNKLFSIMYPNQNIRWFINTSFWQVTTLHDDPFSPKNKGWIHKDGCLMAGVVYLTKDIDRNLGTTIYEQVRLEENDVDVKSMYLFYKDKIDRNYDEAIEKNNSIYEETVKINNRYNRMICFDGNIPHSPSHYYMGNKTRLVQVFFVHSIESDCPFPSQR